MEHFKNTHIPRFTPGIEWPIPPASKERNPPMSASVSRSRARYTSDAVSAAIEHHARLNGRTVTIMSADYDAGCWTVSVVEPSGISEQRWIEDPRPVDVTRADVFHAGTRLGRID